MSKAVLGLAETRNVFRPTAFDGPLCLLVLGAILGSWASYDVRATLPALIVVMSCVLLYYFVVRLSEPTVWATAGVFLGLSVAVYYLGQYQYLSHNSTSRVASWIGYAISSLFMRLGSWEPDFNSVATLVEGLIPVSIGIGLSSRSRSLRLFGAIAAGVMFLAVVVTDSRGAWMALAAACGVWLLSRWRYGFGLVAGALVVSLGAWMGGQLLFQGISLDKLPVVGSLLHEFVTRSGYTSGLVQDFVFTGIGLGDVFGIVYSTYVLLIPHVYMSHAPNLYITVWLGHGLLGAIGFLWLVGRFVTMIVLENRVGDRDMLFQASWIGLIVTLVHGLVDARQYVDLWSMWPMYLLLGLVVSTSSVAVSPLFSRIGTHRQLGRWQWGILALVAILAVVLVWRPTIAAACANLGAVRQAKAELSELGQDADLELAIQNYCQALQIDPKNRTARLRLGSLAMAAGRYEEGIAYLEPVWATSPRDPTARKALGLGYVWVGRIKEAADLLKDSHNIVAELNAWGWWHGQEGRQSISVNAYRTSLALDPDQRQLTELLAEAVE